MLQWSEFLEKCCANVVLLMENGSKLILDCVL